MKIRIGTRSSRLDVIQTELFIKALKEKYPNVQTETVYIMTKGDKVTDRPLSEFGGEGVFAKEPERMLAEGKIDVAVHSAKDMPVDIAEGLEIVCALKRGDMRDVLVTKCGREIEGDNFTVGTGSMRRQNNLKKIYPLVKFADIRGNVDTRIQKLKKGEYDGIILAAAGLERLGIFEDKELKFRIFETDEFLCAPCQGIIAVEGRKGEFKEMLENISDRDTMYCLETEREFMKYLGGGCGIPSSAVSSTDGKFIRITASKDGEKIISCEAEIEKRSELAKKAADML